MGRYKKSVLVVSLVFFSVIFLTLAGSRDVSAAKKRRLHIQPEQLTWVYGNDTRCSLFFTDDRNFITDGVDFYSEDPSLVDITKDGRLILNSRKQKETGKTRLVAVYQGKKYYCPFKKVHPYMGKENITLTLGKDNHNSEKVVMKGATGVDGKALSCIWYSSKPSVAKINKKGKVTAEKEGKTTITCSVNSQMKYSCTVCVVKNEVSAVTLDKTSLDLKKDDSELLKAALLPKNASVKGFEWETDDAKVATVSAAGRVKAVGPGDTIIRVKAKDNAFYEATCKVHVAFDKNDVKLSSETMKLNWTAKTITLTDKTGNLETKDVTWRVEDPSVVKLDEEIKDGYNNTITPKKKGFTKVIAMVKAPDGNVYEYACEVTVDINNNGLNGFVYKKDLEGKDALTMDGILRVKLSNQTNTAFALFRTEEEEDYQPELSMGGGSYKLLVRDCEENDRVFDYKGDSDICSINPGEEKEISFVVKDEDLQKVKKGSCNFRSATVILYLYDAAGCCHEIRISGADTDGYVLEEKTEDDLQSSDGLRIW